MKIPSVRRLVDFWPSTFYTGCVLHAPGYVDVIKFTEMTKAAFQKDVQNRDGPALGWQEGVTAEQQEKVMWEDVNKGLQEEIELKMSPFRETHPTASCFKHHCSLLQCEVLQDSRTSCIFFMLEFKC